MNKNTQQFVRLCDCGCGQPTRAWGFTDTARGRVKGQVISRLRHHGRREVSPEMWTVEASGCWRPFTALGARGYCTFSIAGVKRKAHVVTYEHFIGPVPHGLQLDHLCRNRWCCNPGHLEPVTNRENTRRGLSAKLSHQDVVEIRRSSDSSAELAKRYAVSPSCIKKVRAGVTWADIQVEAAS